MTTEPAGEKEQRQRAEVAEARPGWRLWMVFVITAVTGAGGSIGVSRYNQHQSEQAWCDVVTVLNEAYTDPDPGSPPLTTRGERLARGIAKVARKYHC